MNANNKFPRNQGRPIPVGRARAEQARWRRNPNNNGLKETFPVSVEMILQNLSNQASSGIQFCNGLNNEGDYTPVMGSVDETGVLLSAFDETGEISLEQFKKCRENWKEAHTNPKTIKFFFLGKESIQNNIQDFEVTRYEASFVEKSNGEDSGLLLGFSTGSGKDPGEEDPSTALNVAKLCPPLCDDDE